MAVAVRKQMEFRLRNSTNLVKKVRLGQRRGNRHARRQQAVEQLEPQARHIVTQGQDNAAIPRLHGRVALETEGAHAEHAQNTPKVVAEQDGVVPEAEVR